MRTENAELMRMARETLKGKWGLAIGTYVVYAVIIGVSSVIPVAPLIIAGPLSLGLAIFMLALSRGEDTRLELIFKGFNSFGNSLGAYLLMVLFTVLWMLLLIVPGIIAAISYSMTFFIMADDRNIGAMEAIDKSKKMMYGYKGKFFCLGLRFIGWGLLCLLTCGIGFLWLGPYMYVSMTKFYEDIKDKPVTAEVA